MSLRPETLTIGHGYDPRDAGGAAKPPAYLTSTFVYASAAEAKRLHEAFFDGTENGAKGHIYGRLGHPGLDIVEARLAALDGGEDAACFATGMAAIHRHSPGLPRARRRRVAQPARLWRHRCAVAWRVNPASASSLPVSPTP